MKPLLPLYLLLVAASFLGPFFLSVMLDGFILALFGWRMFAISTPFTWWSSIWSVYQPILAFYSFFVAIGLPWAVAMTVVSLTVTAALSVSVLLPILLIHAWFNRTVRPRIPGGSR